MNPPSGQPADPRLDIPSILPLRFFLEQAGVTAWLAGGTVRDLLLGLEPSDVDVVTAREPEPLARAFADASGGSFFVLSEEFLTCRVVSGDKRFNYDFAAMRGGSIEADLSHRDFTVNAVAMALPAGGALIDPLGGAADIERQQLSPVSEDVFEDDPLRLLRAPRLEQQLGFRMETALEDAIRRQASLLEKPAPERIFRELTMLLRPPGAADAVRRLDGLGLLAVVFPELERLKGVTQNDFHHLDVFEHTLAAVGVIDRIVAEPESFFPGLGGRIAARLERQVSGGASATFVLGLAELLHDVAKPDCRFIDDDGRVRFFEHDRLGAGMAAAILARLRASSDCAGEVSQLVRRHMRFEGLLQEETPSPRARFRYLRATAPLSAESIIMSVADRLSVRGRLVTEADIERHLRLANEMMAAVFAEAEAEPLPRLIDGNDLMKEFGIGPGPLVGRLMAHVIEEQAMGTVASRDEALGAAARFLEQERRGEGG